MWGGRGCGREGVGKEGLCNRQIRCIYVCMYLIILLQYYDTHVYAYAHACGGSSQMLPPHTHPHPLTGDKS